MTAPNVVKDSWAIAQHLDSAYPEKPLFGPARHHAHFVAVVGRYRRASGAVPDPCRRSLRSRAAGRSALFPRLARQAARHHRLCGLPGQGAREGRGRLPRRPGAGAARAEGAAVPERRAACLSRLCAGRRLPVGPRRHARSRCSKPTIRSTPGASACSTCSTAWAARPRLREVRRRHLRSADGADQFLDLVERRRGLARSRHEVAPALSRDHLRLRPLQTL